jgi:hypothetical protein
VVLRFGVFSSSSQALHERRMVDLWWLPVAALGAAGGVALLHLVAQDEAVGGLSLENFLAVVVAWSFIASGLIAWRAGPEVRLGGAASVGGSGLRGLTDRVEALGGRLRVWSPNGGGTRLRAEIPFA